VRVDKVLADIINLCRTRLSDPNHALHYERLEQILKIHAKECVNLEDEYVSRIDPSCECTVPNRNFTMDRNIIHRCYGPSKKETMRYVAC
jgi:hypothetical protein